VIQAIADMFYCELINAKIKERRRYYGDAETVVGEGVARTRALDESEHSEDAQRIPSNRTCGTVDSCPAH